MTPDCLTQEVSIIQIAIMNKIYIIDILKLQPILDDKSWELFKQAYFMNENLTIIGYGLAHDLLAIEKSIKYFENCLTKKYE